jgi:predicted lipoprotein with Yx(FWY)xxD motif
VFPVRITVRPHLRPPARRLAGGSLLLGAVITVAACGASATTAAGSGSSRAAASNGSAGTAATSNVTLSVKSVPGVGTVLVNGQGQTLYLLTSEKGGKITCTASTGCTKFWPEITLPKGATAARAGSGAQSSLLGTVKDASGTLEVTYNGWPVYTYVGDSGPGVAHGQGQASFGGTWYVLNPSGDPVTGPSQPSSAPSSSPSSGPVTGYLQPSSAPVSSTSGDPMSGDPQPASSPSSW